MSSRSFYPFEIILPNLINNRSLPRLPHVSSSWGGLSDRYKIDISSEIQDPERVEIASHQIAHGTQAAA
ncbi:hypothetical protein SLA2020_066430 [Shorea laevis]